MGKIISESFAKEGSAALSPEWSLFSWNKSPTPEKQQPNESSTDPKEACKTIEDKQPKSS